MDHLKQGEVKYVFAFKSPPVFGSHYTIGEKLILRQFGDLDVSRTHLGKHHRRNET